MGTNYDAIVIGLGPAGASAACHLARKGLKVLALEKYALPRHKLCAGGITAKVPPLLTCDYSAAKERDISGAMVDYRKIRTIVMDMDKSYGAVVNRATFDHLLALEAGAAGADIHEAEPVRAIYEAKQGVSVTTTQNTYQARFLIGADGANGITARYLGHTKPSLALGYEVHVKEDFPALREHPNRIALYFGTVPAGYTWIFPRGQGASVGIGIPWKNARHVKAQFAAFLATLELPPELIFSARAHPIPAFSPFHRRPLGRGPILLAGDAAGFVDPVTGEGIYYALKSGRAGAESIAVATNPHALVRDYRRRLWTDVIRELSYAWTIVHPLYAFPGLSFMSLEVDPHIREIYLDVLSGNAGYVKLATAAPKAVLPMIKALLKRTPA
jgi:geranylgeranyl reductase family protein